MKKFILRILGFLFFFISLNILFKYFYEKPIREAILNGDHSTYTKYENINNPANNYNLVFLGSSRGISTYNPKIFDSILGTNSYNMCTGSQNTIETYFILKNILESQKLQYLVYEMYQPSFDYDNDYFLILDNAKFFKSDSFKHDMIIDGFGISGILHYLLPVLKHKDYIRRDIIEFLFNRKNTPINVNNWSSGYYSDDTIVDSLSISEFPKIDYFDEVLVSEKKEDYFRRIVELCNKHKIELICVRSPYPPSRVNKSSIIDNTYIFFDKICKSKSIPYYDLNSIKNFEYNYLDSDFSDTHHLNKYGSTKVSNQIANLIWENHMN